MRLLRDPVTLLLLALLVGWGVFEWAGAPEPAPAHAPRDQFSAARAGDILETLYEDLGPHVAGSAENRLLRDRILGQLETFGYEPEVQRRYHCNPMFAVCGPVENIVAVLEGAGEEGDAILLTAHYDSAWASPGVADDGAGVAALLEIARMAVQGLPLRNDIVFLFSDGEESGLLGAHAFATLHPLFARVRVVINLEARGVEGPSVMFETGTGNRGMIRVLAKNVERPVANSLAYEMYRRMPNDTDLSVYRPYPVAALNFAFTEGVQAYHSAVDDLGRLDRASLQHHGQNAWSVIRALDERTLDKMVSPEDAVYVDLFGRNLLHYPESTAAGMALVISVLVLIAIRRSFPHQLSFRQVSWSFLAVLALAVSFPVAGWLLSWPLGRWPDVHAIGHPYPWLGRAVLFLAALVLANRVAAWLTPRASVGAVMFTSWGLYVVLALGLATTLPAASWVPVLPLLVFMLGLALDGFRWRKEPRLVFSSLFGMAAALYVGFYGFHMLETVVNFGHAALLMAPLVLPAVAALPLMLWHVDRHGSGRWLMRFGAALVVAGCVAQWFVPGYTPDRPRDLTVHYRQVAGEDTAWMVLQSHAGASDPEYAARHAFREMEVPGLDGTALAVATEPLNLPTIEARARRVGEGERGERSRRFIVDLGLPAGLQLLALTLPEKAGLLYASFEGQRVYDAAVPAHRPGQARRIDLHAPPAGAARIEMELSLDAGVEPALIMDARFELPEERLAPFAADWPADARPAFLGPRAIVRYRVPLLETASAPGGED